MLRKATLLLALCAFVATTSAYAQERIQYGDSNKELDKSLFMPGNAPTFGIINNDKYPDGIIGGNSGLPPVMMPEPITEEVEYVAWTDESDTSFSIPNAIDPSEPRRTMVIGDLPRSVEESVALRYRMLGYSQIIPAFNPDDPNATIKIDSVFFWLFRPGGTFPPERPAISTDWILMPVYLNELNKDKDIFERRINRFTMDLLTDFEFTEVNNELGYFDIPAQTINEAIEVDFRGDIIALNGINVHTPDLVLPADRPFVFVVAPVNWDGDDAKNFGDTVRMLGAFEWDLVRDNRGEQALGGMLRRNVTPTDNFIENSDTLMTFWPNLVWPEDTTGRFPTIGENFRIRQNYQLAFWGTYTGEPVVSVREDSRPATDISLGANYPNPASNITNVPFSIIRDGRVTLRVTNILGQVVFETVEPFLRAGSYIWDVDTKSFAEGPYVYTMTIGEQTISRTMTVVR